MLQRILRPVAGIATLLITAALAGFVAPGPGVVQADRIELVDSKGEIQAVLAADTKGVLLTLLDKGGRVAASLRLNGDPRLTVLDGSGREVAGVGAPRVQHLGE